MGFFLLGKAILVLLAVVIVRQTEHLFQLISGVVGVSFSDRSCDNPQAQTLLGLDNYLVALLEDKVAGNKVIYLAAFSEADANDVIHRLS